MKITKEEKYAIDTLLAVTAIKLDQIDEFMEEINDILGLEGDDRECGHVSDAVFGRENFKYLKDRLKIEVEKNVKKKEKA